MEKINKISSFQRRLITVRLMLIKQEKRASYLKKKKIFYSFGERVKWGSSSIPAEPYLVKIGSNVRVAANVSFVTHDIISGLFENDNTVDFAPKGQFYMGTIDIKDNVMIGSNSVIMYNTVIGPNAIIAAGSVVVSDVLPGTIVGGNPAKVIGSYYELLEKRKDYDKPNNKASIDKILESYWEE